MLLAEGLAADPSWRARRSTSPTSSRSPCSTWSARSSHAMGSDLEPEVRNEATNEILAPVPQRRQGARAMLGWRPGSTWSEGLERTIAWYREFLPMPDATRRRADAPPRRSSAWSREYHAAAFAPPRLRARARPPVPVSRPGLRRRRRCVTWSTPRSTSGSPPAASPREFEREFAAVFGVRHAILVNSGSSANLVALTRPHLAQAGRPAAPARRRGHHRRRRLPHHGQPDHPEQAGAGLRRRDLADLQHRRVPARGRARPADPGDHDRPHARQPVRPRRRHGVRRDARPLAGRGLLRRRRARPTTAERRHLRRPRDASASTPRTTSPWARAAAC